MSLQGKTALVTGAGRGIGRAIAVKLASQGASVAINYARNDEEAEQTRRLCEEAGVKAMLVKANVADFAACEQMFKEIEAELGSVDILVNNAGITRDELLIRMTPEQFDAVIDINLKGAFHCIKCAARPMMKKRAGRIINITSVVGVNGNAGQANYAASKAGLIGLTKSAAKELARRGITVNAVAPGYIETDMTAVLSDDIKAEIKKQIPMDRLGKADDVAGLTAFLAGGGADYVTGQVICVDGGMAM